MNVMFQIYSKFSNYPYTHFQIIIIIKHNMEMLLQECFTAKNNQRLGAYAASSVGDI